MSEDELHITNAMFIDVETEKWDRFERMMGIAWYREDVEPLVRDDHQRQKDKAAAAAEGKEVAPVYVPPKDRIKLPLAMIMNPKVITEVAKQLGIHSGGPHDAFGDMDIKGEYQSMYHMQRDQFIKQIGGNRGNDNEIDVRRQAHELRRR